MTLPAGHTKAELQSLKAILDPLGNVVGTYTQGGSESMLVTAKTDTVTGRITKSIWTGTQAQYDAIAVKDADTLYIIVAE